MATNPTFLAYQDSYVPSASLSKSSENSAYPATNVQSLPVSKPWRTTGISSEYVEFDLGFAQQVQLCAILAHNLSASATVTLKGGASANPSTYTQVLTYRQYDMFLLLNQTYRYWRVAFSDSGNPNAYLSVGHIMLGNASQLGCGFAYDYPFNDVYTNLEVPTEFNVPHVAALAYQVALQHTFNNISDANMATIRSLFQKSLKNVYPFFWIPDTSVNDGYLVRFQTDLQRIFGVYKSATISLKEDSRGRSISA